MREFIPIKEVIKSLMDKFGIQTEEFQIKTHWSEIMGDLKDHVKPRSLKDGLLFVEVESPVFRAELKLRKEKILEKMEEFFGGKIVKDILVL